MGDATRSMRSNHETLHIVATLFEDTARGSKTSHKSPVFMQTWSSQSSEQRCRVASRCVVLSTRFKICAHEFLRLSRCSRTPTRVQQRDLTAITIQKRSSCYHTVVNGYIMRERAETVRRSFDFLSSSANSIPICRP